MNRDAQVLRGLASRVMDYATSGEMNRRREQWRAHNAMERTPPLLYALSYAAIEIPELTQLECEGELARQIEYALRNSIYHFERIPDDFVIEPWHVVAACFAYPSEDAVRWGPRIAVTRPKEERGAFYFAPLLRGEEEDFENLREPCHAIDEEASARRWEEASELLGGVMPAYLDRRPYYYHWRADLSTDLPYLRGLEAIMWDMVDRPEWLHRLVAFMQKGVLKVQAEAEAAGGWSFLDHANQAMTYARGIGDPGPGPARRDQLWTFCASQETTTVSPAMWEEFILAYQAPIMNRFALSAYGCCEDLTNKIPLLKKHVKNLRRVAVTPWANLRKCAEQIGSDVIASWRPNPADIAESLDADRVRRTTREAFAIFKEHGCVFDVTLKDVETVSHNQESVPGWVRCVREVIEEGNW